MGYNNSYVTLFPLIHHWMNACMRDHTQQFYEEVITYPCHVVHVDFFDI